jgi:hypothetical protein
MTFASRCNTHSVRSLALCLFTAFSLFLASNPAYAQPQGKTGKVHILIVADTNAHGANIFGLGIDGDKMKEMFDQGFARTGKQGDYTLALFKGSNVSPHKIRQYYQSLNSGPDDTILFYYTGHGITDRSQGHMMTMSGGNMTRKDILAEMSRHNPRLLVLLTDCCANYGGGGFFGLGQPIKGGFDTDERRGFTLVPGFAPGNVAPAPFQPAPSVPADQFTDRRENGSQIVPAPSAPFKPSVKPTVKPTTPSFIPPQPPVDPLADRRGTRPSSGQPYVPPVVPNDNFTPPTPSSGDLALVHLLFHHKGVVDINASKIGESASGNAGLGGSYFTVALWKTMILPAPRIDSNNNGTAEWSEIFPMLDSATIEASQRGGFHQRPQAFKLAQAG